MEHPSIKTRIYSIQDLEQHYKNHPNNKGAGHWFDKDTMRFFNSRVSESLVYDKNCKRILFFSSELGPNQGTKRRFSIREYNLETGKINTIGLGFQGYKTLAAAKRAAQILVVNND